MNGRASAAPKKGENYELKSDLHSPDKEKRADAIKRTVASMTVGKDVSGLFPDILVNMQTDDLEQKKLVYLYLINYAATQPELVILAVNTFVKDTADPNPLVRALAIRTMGCLRAEKIIDYLADPLQKCLQDENPYVRKTAALAVAKLYDLKPELAVDNGFVEQLKDMVGDSNPMVVANAVAALTDIHETSLANYAAATASAGSSSPISPTSANAPQGVFIIDSHVLNKLLVALNECSEWGRIAILSALAKYKANDSEESEHICERVMPQFQHANGAVLLTAVRVVMIHMKNVERDDLIKQLIRKMAPPLVTLVSSAPEIQWVALRNINLLLQKRPDILPNEMRVFFCKYNDPPYVKVEKLDIMVRLAGPKNVDTLLSELKEYASEVDVDFVRKSIKAIGQTAIKIDDAAERCIGVLLDLISTRVSYVVQEAIVVIKDIFRKYPHSYEGIIPTLCASLDELDEPEAKASLIWIIGEYADKIDNADDLLGIFLKTFKEESYQVQLQTLTAIVKLFLKKPDESQAIVQKVLQMATKDCDSPDVRDRAYVYWRLLSTDPAAAKAVVLADRPPISLPQTSVPPPILEELLGEISTLASVYHKPAETFVGRGRIGIDDLQKRATETEDLNITREKAIHTVEQGQKAENLLDFDDDPIPGDSFDAFGVPSSISTSSSVPHSTSAPVPQRNALDDIMSLFADQSMNPPATITPQQQPSSIGGGGGFGQPLQQQQARPTASPPAPPPAQPSGGGDLLDFL